MEILNHTKQQYIPQNYVILRLAHARYAKRDNMVCEWISIFLAAYVVCEKLNRNFSSFLLFSIFLPLSFDFVFFSLYFFSIFCYYFYDLGFYSRTQDGELRSICTVCAQLNLEGFFQIEGEVRWL